jgi:outer membrane receptor protein involved in Fe transport
MPAAAVSLDAVEVVSEKPLLSAGIDRRVYNVEQDIASRSSSVSELLANVPSVEVDIEGNVSVRGSGNVLFLINGKESPLLGSNAATVLQQMPANAVDRIEVMTNPSAKYKPDGTGGIINIVLKKNTALGMNGSVALNAGSNDRYNATARANLNPGPFNLEASYSYRQDSHLRSTTDHREESDSASAATGVARDGQASGRPRSHMLGLGAEFTPDTRNAAGVSGSAFFRRFSRFDSTRTVSEGAAGVPLSAYDRLQSEGEDETEYEATAFYQHTFEEDRHYLRVEASEAREDETESNSAVTRYRVPADPALLDRYVQEQMNRNDQVKVDYHNALGGTSTLEAGYQAEFNRNDVDISADTYDGTLGAWVPDAGRSNRYVFDETVHALYATWEQSFGAFGALAGLRGEYARHGSELITLDTSVANSYASVYPTLHLRYALSEAEEYHLSYSRRVRRPDGEDLNPFPEYDDPRNLSAGNPRLLPEYIHSVELGYRRDAGRFSFMPALYYRYTTNRFTSVTSRLNDSTLLTTRENLSNDQAAGGELVVSGAAGRWLTAHASVNAFYNTIDATALGYGDRKSIVTWSGALSMTLKPWEGTSVQLQSNYRSARLSPQGEYLPSFSANMGIRQVLLENRLAAVLTVSDLFATQRRKMQLDLPTLSQTVTTTRDSRIVFLGLTCTFGTAADKEREESLRYDDGI